MMMGHREEMKGGAEYDKLTRWGRKLYGNKAGRATWTKAHFSRRVRREAKIDLRAPSHPIQEDRE